MYWRGSLSGRTGRWCGAHGGPPPSPFRLHIPLRPKTLGRYTFSSTGPERRRHRRQDSGDRSLCSGTLTRRGIALGAISIDSIVVADSYDEE